MQSQTLTPRGAQKADVARAKCRPDALRLCVALQVGCRGSCGFLCRAERWGGSGCCVSLDNSAATAKHCGQRQLLRWRGFR
eukprot:214697-Prymnesium_polylepis.1